MSQILHIVDAFTDKPFAGNPAAVAILDSPADELWMKRVAREMNLSETAFLHPSTLANLPVRGVIVTARSAASPFDFVSRFFAPAAGVNEDPVTGSAHCALGPYWKGKLNKDDFIAYQVSERGGIVKLSVRDNRVLLLGQAVMMSRVELLH